VITLQVDRRGSLAGADLKRGTTAQQCYANRPRRHSDSQAPSRVPKHRLIEQEVVRNFTPGELDFDDLAEAIRCLLGNEPASETQRPSGSDPDLLLPRPRVSHVVGATKTP